MFQHGKFVSSASKKSAPPKDKEPEKKPSAARVAHENPNEPKTQPHPVTGVHKVVVHHTGGGKFETHTHHDSGGGEPEKQQHESAQEMHDHVNSAMPDDGSSPQDSESDMPNDGAADDMGSVLGSSLGEYDAS